MHGVEPEGKSGDRAEGYSHLSIHRGYLELNTFPPQSFDAVVLTHVFEHLSNPLEIIDIISVITKENAILQIEIPNIDSWQYTVFKSNWLHLDPPRHLNMFPPKVLVQYLAKQGWVLEKKEYFSPQFSPFGVQQSLLNVFLDKRDVLYEHLKQNVDYVSSYSPFHLFLQKLFHWTSYPLFLLTDALASAFNKGATVKFRFRKIKNS